MEQSPLQIYKPLPLICNELFAAKRITSAVQETCVKQNDSGVPAGYIRDPHINARNLKPGGSLIAARTATIRRESSRLDDVSRIPLCVFAIR